MQVGHRLGTVNREWIISFFWRGDSTTTNMFEVVNLPKENDLANITDN